MNKTNQADLATVWSNEDYHLGDITWLEYLEKLKARMERRGDRMKIVFIPGAVYQGERLPRLCALAYRTSSDKD